MKMKWVLMSALGLLAPVAVATPVLATSCGDNTADVTEVDRPTPVTEKIVASDKTFDEWQKAIQDKANFENSIKALFGTKAGGVTKDNIDSIEVTKKETPKNDTQTEDVAVHVKVTLKEKFEFKKTDSADKSQSMEFDVTVTLKK